MAAEEEYNEERILNLLSSPHSEPSTLKRYLGRIVNAALGVEESRENRYADVVKKLVSNVGYNNGFALLSNAYLTAKLANQNSEPNLNGGPSNQIVFGKLLKHMASIYPQEYLKLDFANLTFDVRTSYEFFVQLEKSAAEQCSINHLITGVFIGIIGVAASIKLTQMLLLQPIQIWIKMGN